MFERKEREKKKRKRENPNISLSRCSVSKMVEVKIYIRYYLPLQELAFAYVSKMVKKKITKYKT